MEPLKQEFLDLSDKFHARFTSRIEGLTDEEYLWEPAPDCWSLRPDRDGKLRQQWGLIFDEPAPVTTIAWRYTHISDLLCEERCATFIGVEPEQQDYFADGAPPDVAAARDVFDRAFARWKRYVAATEEDKLFDAIGPVSPGFGDRTRATFVLHILDEAIHHAAEVGVLRDIYRAQQEHDPAVSALLTGGQIDAAAADQVKTKHPDLVLRAAATANWGAIGRLMDLGFGIDGRDGRTPLHHAAADGAIELMQRLIDAGADLEAKDPIYHATPHEWAVFFDRVEAAEFLKEAYRLRSRNA